METKLFEIRDRMTMIPALATKLMPPRSESERFLLSWVGYRSNPGEYDSWIILVHFSDTRCQNDAYVWREEGTRTMFEAHKYIEQYWDELQSGDVIDIEFILKEKTEKKESVASKSSC
jgi:hypothetical protein